MHLINRGTRVKRIPVPHHCAIYPPQSLRMAILSDWGGWQMAICARYLLCFLELNPGSLLAGPNDSRQTNVGIVIMVSAAGASM